MPKRTREITKSFWIQLQSVKNILKIPPQSHPQINIKSPNHKQTEPKTQHTKKTVFPHNHQQYFQIFK